jgi:hypothetical protein
MDFLPSLSTISTGLKYFNYARTGYSIAGIYTGKTDSVGKQDVLSDVLTSNASSNVMDKMKGCWERLTTEEVKNNRGLSSLFFQTGETRKANTLRYLINHDKSNTSGELNTESKKRLLNQAQKAMQFSRQAEHLFCDIAKANAMQPELHIAKKHCEDLLYLYAERDKLNRLALKENSKSAGDNTIVEKKSEPINEKDIVPDFFQDISEDNSTKEDSKPAAENKLAKIYQLDEQRRIIDARIIQAESDLQDALDDHFGRDPVDDRLEADKNVPLDGEEANKDANLRTGFREFRREFQLVKPPENQSANSPQNKSKYQIEDFIRFYAFKVKLMDVNDTVFKKQVYDDFRQYIFCSSVGHLSAGETLAYKYGALIKDLLDESSMGDVDSQSGNISQYFMQTVHNLLNTGQSGFSLAELCIGRSDQTPRQDEPALPKFGHAYACSGYYYLEPEGKKIVDDIVAYYTELSEIVGSDPERRLLPMLNEPLTKTLLWNLLGGEHSEKDNKFKRGMFYRIDEQLKGFVSKTEDAIHSKLDAIDNKKSSIFDDSHRDIFVKKLPPNPYLENQNFTTVFAYQPAVNQTEHIERLNLLQRIAARCQLDQLGNDKLQDSANKNQLRMLKLNYERELAELDNRDFYDAYFKTIVGEELYYKFMDIRTQSDEKQVDAILKSGWDPVATDLSKNCIDSAMNRKEAIRNQNFDIVLTNNDVIDTHIEIYTETAKKLRKDLLDSEPGKEIKQIIDGLSNLSGAIKFYNSIIVKKAKGKQVGLIATPTNLVALAKVAVLGTKKHVEALYNRHKELHAKYGEDRIGLGQNNSENYEQEIFEYSLLEALFNFIAEQSGTEPPPINADLTVSRAVNNCLKKLDRMKYIDLATKNINARNSKRILLQLTKQKDILVQFATIFSVAGTTSDVREWKEFLRVMDIVMADLRAKCNELHKADDEGTSNAEFNKLCARMNTWLIQAFTSNSRKNIVSEFSYPTEINDQKITLTIPEHIFDSCYKHYNKLQGTNFSCGDWSKCSAVHKALLVSMLDNTSSIISKMTLHIGQIFSDGYTFNPRNEDISQFNSLLTSFEKAVSSSLSALSELGYSHQRLLGHYDNLISGVSEVLELNAAVKLRGKLIVALLDYEADSSPEKQFVCELTDNEKKLYLKLLNQSKLDKYPDRHGKQLPKMVFAEDDPRVEQFDLFAPKVFIDPVQVVGKVLARLKNQPKMNDASEKLNNPLTDLADEAAGKIKAINDRTEVLRIKLAANHIEIKDFSDRIHMIGTKLTGRESFVASKDSIDACNQLLEDFKVKEVVSAKVGANVINIMQIDSMHIADLYHTLFFNLFYKVEDTRYRDDVDKIKDAFEILYDEIKAYALRGEIAMFADVNPTDMLNLDTKGQVDRELRQSVITTIEDITRKKLSGISQPLDRNKLEEIYTLCSDGKNENDKKLIRCYLNAFQYQKIDQCIAYFYINANNNLPELATHLNSLYEVSKFLYPRKAGLDESNHNIVNTESFVIEANDLLDDITNSMVEWESLLLNHSNYAWLVGTKYDDLEKEHSPYFKWFTETYVKLNIVKSSTGPLRDELQIMVILDYLMAYKDVGKINPKDIDLIKRFYYAPQELKDDTDALARIRNALTNINNFLSTKDNDKNVLQTLLKNLTTTVWAKITGYWSKVDNDKEVRAIKHQLQELYDQFYNEIIQKANDTQSKINTQNVRLNQIKRAYIGISQEKVFNDLCKEFEKVDSRDNLFQIFADNADQFYAISTKPGYAEMLKLVVDAIKARNLKDEPLQSIRAENLTASISIFGRLYNEFQNVRSYSDLLQILADDKNAAVFRAMLSTPEFSDMLNLFLERVKSNNPESDDGLLDATVESLIEVINSASTKEVIVGVEGVSSSANIVNGAAKTDKKSEPMVWVNTTTATSTYS